MKNNNIMALENSKTKEDLRDLIDNYAYLGDEKNISEQMELFTADLIYKVYMDDILVANVSGREQMEKGFNFHSSLVKTYFTLNGQHTVKIDDNGATGISFSQIKMIREQEGQNILSDYSVRYEDSYILQNGKWLIKERIGHFIIIETRPV